MILINKDLLKAIDFPGIIIDILLIHKSLAELLFNPSSIDLRLGLQISIPEERSVILNSSQGGIYRYLAENSKFITLTKQRLCMLPTFYGKSRNLVTHGDGEDGEDEQDQGDSEDEGG